MAFGLRYASVGRFGEILEQVAANGLELLHGQRRARKIAIAQDVVRVLQCVSDGLSDADAAASMCLAAAAQLAQASRRLTSDQLLYNPSSRAW